MVGAAKKICVEMPKFRSRGGTVGDMGTQGSVRKPLVRAVGHRDVERSKVKLKSCR